MVVVSLAVGIGANTTVFSFIQARVLRPLPGVADATRFQLIEPRTEAGSYPGLRKIPARIFVVLGPLLLVLAAIGMYAVVAYSVAHRTAEIGVRLALGATARVVIAQMVRDTMRVVTAGAAIGWLMASGAYVRLIQKPVDYPVFLGVPVVLAAVSLTATWLPARRASRIDPVAALRQ